MPSESRLDVVPEALPGHVCAAQEIGVERFSEGIVVVIVPMPFVVITCA
jgi:hypothetical protein